MSRAGSLTLTGSLISSRLPSQPGRKLVSSGQPASAARKLTNNLHETPISTVEDPPEAAARFSQPQLDQERTGHSPESPPCRSQTFDARLTWVGGMSTPAPVRFKLTRSMRLQQGREFASLREQGRRLAKGCLVANWAVLPDGSTPRLGVITSRKLGKAHVRTRARRLLRETFRLHQHDLRSPVALVLVARSSIVGRSLCEVEQDYLWVLRKAELLKANE
jgi:ribonuclease P protein component